MIKIMENYDNLIANYSKIPKYLYHATLYDYLDNIQKYGLGKSLNKVDDMYDDLYQGDGIFLSYDPSDAEMYLLYNYDPDDIVVLQVPKSILDKDKIYYDTNNEDNIENPTSWYYKGIIKNPQKYLRLVEL